jgi:hypothetical protein
MDTRQYSDYTNGWNCVTGQEQISTDSRVSLTNVPTKKLPPTPPAYS